MYRLTHLVLLACLWSYHVTSGSAVTSRDPGDLPNIGDPCYVYAQGSTPDPPPVIWMSESLTCPSGGLRWDIAVGNLNATFWYQDHTQDFSFCFTGGDSGFQVFVVNGDGSMDPVEVPVYPPDGDPPSNPCVTSTNMEVKLIIEPPPGILFIAMLWWDVAPLA